MSDGRTRGAKMAAREAMMRERFLAHLGDDATEENRADAERAARFAVIVGELEREGDRRELASHEHAAIAIGSAEVERLARKLGVKRLRRRA